MEKLKNAKSTMRNKWNQFFGGEEMTSAVSTSFSTVSQQSVKDNSVVGARKGMERRSKSIRWKSRGWTMHVRRIHFARAKSKG